MIFATNEPLSFFNGKLPKRDSLTFIQLLTGYRSLDEPHYAIVDCWANGAHEALLNILFQSKPRISGLFHKESGVGRRGMPFSCYR